MKKKIFPHPFVSNSNGDWEDMLRELDIESVSNLYSDVPTKFLLKQDLDIPGPLSELEVVNNVSKILGNNRTNHDLALFLGAGVWPHYVPAAVSEIISRSEFLTSYTPYQPEPSQGILQVLFEYQSLVAELLEMDVINASMYDWATALGEAGRMAGRLTKRGEIVVPKFVSPDRKAVLETYINPMEMSLVEVAQSEETGQIVLEDLKEKVSPKTAAVYLENPSYLGYLETELESVADITHDAGALFVVGVDPTSLGIIRPPGDYAADIVVGEGQPLGNPMNFGGPLLGIMACRSEMKMIRSMPGRIVSLTRTMDDLQRAFVLSLQTREQHVRREAATSNICSNNALCAVASAVYLSLLGKRGIIELGRHILAKTHYAIAQFRSISEIEVPVFRAPHFKEFTIRFRHQHAVKMLEKLRNHKIFAGKSLNHEFPELKQTILTCVTELHSKDQIDEYVETLDQLLR
jgi:glycine dehydrogenase subunit 1